MNQTREQKLGTENLPRLMASLAIPSVIAQLINVLYNIIDRMYIGHIQDVGPIALTGVGLTFPIIMMISAFSAFIGAGGAPLASIALGKGDRDRAAKNPWKRSQRSSYFLHFPDNYFYEFSNVPF
mgnify:CR=1 FL=1